MTSEKGHAPSPACVPWLWAGNLMLIAFVFLAALLVDGNGRLPGLNETLSTLVFAGLIGAGLLLTTMLACLDRRRIVFAVVAGAFYMLVL